MIIETLQINGPIEVYRTLRNNIICVTKRCKLNQDGFVCPKFLREIDILKRLNNPEKKYQNHPGRDHIIKILDVYENDNYLCVDLENCDGNLVDLDQIADLGKFKEIILLNISDALQYIHKFDIVYCDLSLKNILYKTTNSLIPKFILTDFGNSMYIDQVSLKVRIHTYSDPTYYTMSPELTYLGLVANGHITPSKADIDKNYNISKNTDSWSLGCLSYLLHTKTLYTPTSTSLSEHSADLDQKISEKIPSSDLSHTNGSIWNRTKLMLIHEPTLRPCIYFSKFHQKITPVESPNNKRRLDGRHMRYKINDYIDIAINILKYEFYFLAPDIVKHYLHLTNTESNNNIINSLYDPLDMSHTLYINNAQKYVRIITIMWLISHLYVNDVMNLDELITSIRYTGYYCEIRDINNVCFTVLDAINWKLN